MTMRAWSTAAKREAAARTLLEAVAGWPGVTGTRKDARDWRPREIMVTLRKGPYYCRVDFDGDSRQDCLVIPWNVDCRSAAKYPAHFPAGNVNPYHFAKATTVADDLEDALYWLERGFAALSPEGAL